MAYNFQLGDRYKVGQASETTDRFAETSGSNFAHQLTRDAPTTHDIRRVGDAAAILADAHKLKATGELRELDPKSRMDSSVPLGTSDPNQFSLFGTGIVFEIPEDDQLTPRRGPDPPQVKECIVDRDRLVEGDSDVEVRDQVALFFLDAACGRLDDSLEELDSPRAFGIDNLCTRGESILYFAINPVFEALQGAKNSALFPFGQRTNQHLPYLGERLGSARRRRGTDEFRQVGAAARCRNPHSRTNDLCLSINIAKITTRAHGDQANSDLAPEKASSGPPHRSLGAVTADRCPLAIDGPSCS